MPYLQLVNGKYRIRIVVPLELRPYLPPPHTGKANLTRALGTGMLFTYAFDNEHITTNPMARVLCRSGRAGPWLGCSRLLPPRPRPS